MVSGILPESYNNNNIFATFGRNASETVKVWDVRMNQSPVSEITLPPSNRGNSSRCGIVNAVTWLMPGPGILSIAYEDSIRNYDTSSPGSRAVPVGVSYLSSDDGVWVANNGDVGDDYLSVQCLITQPQSFTYSSKNNAAKSNTHNPFEYYPHRSLAVTLRGQVHVIPESQIAPLAVSKRDGRVASALYISNTTRGPAAMESSNEINSEDISSQMMRRAPSTVLAYIPQSIPHATDNLQTLEEQKEHILAEKKHLLLINNGILSAEMLQSSMTKFAECISQIIVQLLNCWRWIVNITCVLHLILFPHLTILWSPNPHPCVTL